MSSTHFRHVHLASRNAPQRNSSHVLQKSGSMDLSVPRLCVFKPVRTRLIQRRSLGTTCSAAEVMEVLSSPPALSTLGAEVSVALGAAGMLTVLEGRPRGWAQEELVQVRQSTVHGLGVFALKDIPRNSVLGAYPGYLRSPQDMAAKGAQFPNAKGYCWRNENGFYWDPTDAEGEVSSRPGPGMFWPLDVDTTLCRVNEPPIGFATVNVDSKYGDQGEVFYFTLVDIRQGEELFIDYGADYDRSSYGPLDK